LTGRYCAWGFKVSLPSSPFYELAVQSEYDFPLTFSRRDLGNCAKVVLSYITKGGAFAPGPSPAKKCTK
jgi:hypothetical protein